MDIDYREQVACAVKATRILSDTSYSWFGQRSQPLPRDLKEPLNPEAKRNCMIVGLQHQLYESFYSQGLATPASTEDVSSSAANVAEHVERLSDANTGQGYWDYGWQIEDIQTDFAEVSKQGLKLRASPYDLENNSTPFSIGQICRLRFSNEERGMSPGFYTAVGDHPLTGANDSNVFRLYWNITADGSIELMRNITCVLNHAGIPFRFKTLKDPARYTRCDSAVLYLRRSDAEHVARAVSDWYDNLRHELNPLVPAFTQQVAPGIGLAEDPGLLESFGLHRCRLVAEGIINAYARGVKSLKERVHAVENRFSEVGISLDQPFLNAASTDPKFSITQRRLVPHHSAREPDNLLTGEQLLNAARKIGDTLCEEAWWHEGRCNWLAPVHNPDEKDSLSATAKYQALGCELYAGTSGIALFLAELHAADPDPRLRHTALGAIRQAFARINSVPAKVRLGLYSGWTGIAVASVRIAQLLQDEECLSRAASLIQDLVNRIKRKPRSEFDVISGNAGAVFGLLVLHSEFRSQELLDSAVILGDRLLRSADKSDFGYSWKSIDFATRQNLTGFSHGTAGAGSALLELANSSGDSRYQKAAIRAFDYERYWFDAIAQNWPDFRQPAGLRSRARGNLLFATAWCHGAPGIALSRLRAWELTRDDTCLNEAIIAVRTTKRMIQSALESRDASLSLCHGICGNADVLMVAEAMLGNASTTLLSEIARYVQPKFDTPGLMTGGSGIGYFYLRLRNPAVPSVLLLRPRFCGLFVSQSN